MAINKVIVNGETKLDLTADTVTENKVVKGLTFHDATGELKTGTFEGTAGESPFYFYKVRKEDIIDEAGMFDRDDVPTFNITIDRIISDNDGSIYSFWVYGNYGIESCSGSYTTQGSSYEEFTPFYIFATKPIVSISAHTDNPTGY